MKHKILGSKAKHLKDTNVATNVGQMPNLTNHDASKTARHAKLQGYSQIVLGAHGAQENQVCGLCPGVRHALNADSTLHVGIRAVCESHPCWSGPFPLPMCVYNSALHGIVALLWNI